MRRGLIGGTLIALLVVPTPASTAGPRARDLLPDLVALPTRSVAAGGLNGACAPLETAEQGAARCLRFDQIVANVGDGPFELRYGIETVASTQELRQRVYRSDGSFSDRFADEYEFHAAHGHFHYKSFGMTRLWASDVTGQRLGNQPLRSGRKNGFCVVDVENQWAGGPESVDEPHYVESQCQTPSSLEGEAIEMIQGISRGWADIYGAHLEGQYVEITGIPDGFYLLETIADPDDTVLESKDRNNEVYSHMQLCQEGRYAQLYPPPPGFDFCAPPG